MSCCWMFVVLLLYQSAFYLPVVLSLAVIGFIWQLHVHLAGVHQQGPRGDRPGNPIDWLGNPSLNMWAVLVAASWRHVGYVMVLYLAGLKSVDPTLREAAKVDGANAAPDLHPGRLPGHAADQHRDRRRHRDRVAPRVRHRLHHQPGKNGLELLSVLITNNSIGEASLLGFGSAIAVVLLVCHRSRSRSSSPG